MKTFLLAIFSVFFIHIAAHSQIITTVAGGGAADPGDGGAATDCELNTPTGVAVDAAGNMYICQRDEHRVRKVTPGGVISTIAGTGVAGYSGDGGSAALAQLQFPYCIAIDVSGNIYIGDQSTIRKISTTGFIATVAGTGTMGYSGDNGPGTAALLKGPSAIAVDMIGNVYVTDAGNNRIRRINASGTITTVAGTGATLYNGDNIPATNANLYSPTGVAIDHANNLIIIDHSHYRVRKVTPDGNITTIAGTGVVGFAGDGGAATAAQIKGAIGICTDLGGNLYLSDTYNDRVRKINSTGIITTIGGNGLFGFDGDGGPATAARIVTPAAITVDPSGSLLVCDFGNDRIRRISNVVSVDTRQAPITQQPTVQVFPNPSNRKFDVSVNCGYSTDVIIVLTNISGDQISKHIASSNSLVPIYLDAPTGVYFLHVFVGGHRLIEKVHINR